MNFVKRGFLYMGLLLFAAHTTLAQHEGHQPPPPKPAASPATSPRPQPSPQPTETSSDSHAGMDHGLLVVEDDRMFVRVGNSHANLLPMGRMGSGTSWQPASSVMPMMHKQADDWLLMFHYNFTAGVNAQGGPRGVTKFESANWFMPSAIRRVGNGTLEL